MSVYFKFEQNRNLHRRSSERCVRKIRRKKGILYLDSGNHFQIMEN